jgi:hypothetical protein
MTGATSALTTAAAVMSTVKAAQGFLDKPKAPKVASIAPAQAPAFNPVKPMALARPEGLGEYANFDQNQERSALATKGINQGLGKDESAYYKNLVQRSLIGDDNKPAADTNSLLPVESQYFSQQGMNTSGIMDFLKQLQGTQ